MQYLLLAEGPGAGFAGSDRMVAILLMALAAFFAAHIIPAVSLYYTIRSTNRWTRIIALVVFIGTASPLSYIWWQWAQVEVLPYFM